MRPTDEVAIDIEFEEAMGMAREVFFHVSPQNLIF
jgi:hypothetical protein